MDPTTDPNKLALALAAADKAGDVNAVHVIAAQLKAISTPAPANPNDPTAFLNGPVTAQPTQASGLAGKAFDEAVGERVGLDPGNYEAVNKYVPNALMPVVDLAAKAGDLLNGGINAGIAGGIQGVGNAIGASPTSTEDAARSTTELANIGSLMLGEGHPPVSAVEQLYRKGASVDEIMAVADATGAKVNKAQLEAGIKYRDDPANVGKFAKFEDTPIPTPEAPATPAEAGISPAESAPAPAAGEVPPAPQAPLTEAPTPVQGVSEPAPTAGSRLVETAHYPEQGTTFLDYHPEDGSKPIPIELVRNEDGSATVSIDEFSTDANRVGVGTVRQVARELKARYPEITSFQGERSSGATPGRIQSVPAEALPAEAAAGAPPSEPPVPPELPASGEPPQGPGPDVVSRLTAALNQADKLSPEQQGLYSADRASRLGTIAGVREGTGGEAGFRAELAQLKGPMSRVDFEPVRDKFTQPDVDSLFDTIKNNDKLSLYDQISARTGLAKLLDGKVPAPKELELLGKTFSPDFIKAAIRNKNKMSTVMDVVNNAANIPRSLMSSIDLSAPFRQGLFLVSKPEFWKAFPSMFRQLGSDKAFQAVIDDIHSRPTYPLMQDSGLALTDVGHDLSNREEAFMSNYAERIPLVGRAVKASDRAYTGFLNKLRADTFDSLVNKSYEAGINFDKNPKALKDISKFINNATGRGDLGKLENSGPLLNSIFFSPRFIASRVNLLNPKFYADLSPVVRKDAIKSLLAFGAIATTVASLAKAGGADVETDPRSSDFAKIKTGNTRYDILGGFGQYLTLAARLATNEKKTAKGDVEVMGQKFGSPTRLDAALNFGINKESPIASFITDYLRGKNGAGEAFDLKSEAVQRMIPLFLQDMNDVIQDTGSLAKGVTMSAPGLFGVGMQTYSNSPAPQALVHSLDAKEANDEIARLAPSTMGELGPGSGTLTDDDGTKVALTPDQRTQLQTLTGTATLNAVKAAMRSPGWAKASDDDKRDALKDLIKDARDDAKEQVLYGQKP